MRFLSFKKKYVIWQGLKRTTLRKNKKHLGLHQIRQGSYFKPEVAPFLIRILRIEPKGLGELTPKEIQVDLGLTDEEFASIRDPYPEWADFQVYLLKQFRKISGIKTFGFEDAAYLHYFERYYPNKGCSLDKFMKSAPEVETGCKNRSEAGCAACWASLSCKYAVRKEGERDGTRSD